MQLKRIMTEILTTLVVGIFCGCAWGSTTPGTTITNQALVGFRNSSTGIISQVSSNVVSVNVAAVEAVQLTSNNTISVLPGASFTTLHVLTNTGNLTTTYTISLAPVAGSSASPTSVNRASISRAAVTATLTTLVGYWDQNKNGQVDPGEPTISSSMAITLQPGESTNLIVYGVLSANSAGGSSVQVQLTATSTVQGAQASNLDTIQVQAAALQLTKSSDVTSSTPNSDVTFTISATNIGTASATGTAVTVNGSAQNLIVLRDEIPANSVFNVVTLTNGGTVLYHHIGDPTQQYSTAQPADKTTIDVIAFGFSQVGIGQTIDVAFKVTIMQSASGAITNIAEIYASNGSTPLNVLSNQVNIALPSAPPTIAFYGDSGFSHITSVSLVGSSLYVQANAAQCNQDPAVAETHTISLTSSLTLDKETFTAAETGPNTGVFRIVPDVPTRDGASNQVVKGNGIMEILRGDVLTAVLQGCGSASVQTTMLISPGGVVFESKTNTPVANATVSLIDVTGQGNGGHPGGPASVISPDGVTAAPSSVTTGSDGRFSFPSVAPSTYQLVIAAPAGFTFPSTLPTTQLPTGRNIDPKGSYDLTFNIAVPTAIQIDIPLDRSAGGTTMLEKVASKSTAAIGDFVDYTVTVKNVSSAPATNMIVKDTLPHGFSYQLGTTEIGGSKAPDPQGGHGPALQFAVGTLAANSQTTITYRANVGQGTHLGTNANLAVATNGVTTSNTGSAIVQVEGGAFRQEGFIVGKVYMDCNGNRKQDAGELGVPGVRVILEDQTYAITDGQGKYSIYGVLAHTHIVKLDRLSLPAGFHAVPLSNRNSGDGETRFADLKSGEMLKADFASSCSAELTAAVMQRRATPEYSRNRNDEAVLGMTFNYDTTHRGVAEVKAAGAAGIIGAPSNAVTSASSSVPAGTSALVASITAAKTASGETAGAASEGPAPKTNSAAPALEELAKDIDNKVGFINLEDGQILGSTQTAIRVKGPKDSAFKLLVNDQEVSEKRVGKKVSNAAHAVDAWEFVGVEIRPGTNKLLLLQFDQFGNERGREQIHAIAPKELRRLQLGLPKNAVADGKTPAKIAIRLLDADNVPVMVQTEVTLESSDGEWQVKDVDQKEPGIQVFIEGGSAEFLLKPPTSPVAAKIRVTAGNAQTDAIVDFLPELRPMIAAGVIDETFDFRSFCGTPSTSAGLGEAFEQQLTNLSVSNATSTIELQSHAAFSLKGTVLKSYLVTLAYDSDKSSNEQLFRDIQPDDFYPVYGDSSIRGFDAQSTSRAYLRIDKGKDYLLYGDFTTQDANPARFLSIYTRSATGVRDHYQNGFASVTTFASHDSRTQFVEEIPANGTSGPYMLKNANGVVNSETVEILVRDRNQPSLVLSKTTETRFTDYEFDNTLRNIIFKMPIHSLDSNLNPVSIRVSYEVDQGGAKFWLAGIDTNFKLNSKIQIGGMYISDMNPADQYRLMGFNSTVKLANKTTLTSEFARTKDDLIGVGTGYHFELQHESSGLTMRTYLGRTTATFDNQNAMLNSGRGEGGMKVNWRLKHSNRIVIDAIRTEGTTTGGTQVGAQISFEHTLQKNALFEFGLKHVQTGSATTAINTTTSTTSPTPSSTDAASGTTVTSLRSRLTMALPNFTKLRVYTEFEQDVESADKRNISVGGTYQLFERGKLYVRHELISSLGNTYSLNSQQQEAVTVFGIDTNYMKNEHVFSEYRGNNSFAGRDTEAAIGLRNVWLLRQGLRVNTSIESVKVLTGSDATNNLALTASAEYTASPLWKGTGRFEWRTSSSTRSFMNTLGASVRINPTWTFLGRELLNVSDSTNGTLNTSHQERLQFGFAYRDVATSVFNGLAMVEIKDLHTATATAVTIDKVTVLSANFNYQPASPWVFTGRYATRLTIDESDSLASNSADNLLSGRMTYDLNPKWDLGVNTMIGFSRGFGSLKYGFGPECGRMLAKNVWLSFGYNVFGFNDTDLTSEKETDRGAFVRLRYKFDERIFQKGGR
jgi:uncharacterized repeat protein (TIGR01451 family)